MNFEYSDNYARAFADLAEIHFQERMFPNELLKGWFNLVNSIKKGYDDIPPEFDHDVDCARDNLDYFLNDRILNSYSEHKIFAEYIYQIDKDFIEVTQPFPQINIDSKKLWANRLPKFAGRTYVDFFGQEYLTKLGIVINII